MCQYQNIVKIPLKTFFKCNNSHTQRNILLVGLDSCGKSAILRQIKPIFSKITKQLVQVGFVVQSLQTKHTQIISFDLGGGQYMLRTYQNYFANTSHLIFVVKTNYTFYELSQIKFFMNAFLINQALENAKFAPFLSQNGGKSVEKDDFIIEELNFEFVNREKTVLKTREEIQNYFGV
ncbi:ADP-ribosylation_factor like protein 2a [Hexamita inflata]|uniref:ADP-ribosylation factor like protein 2a n=1 Tax=Hexamita inflata TaxID=28002 RepID=A0AA86Q139_9EUKA|nr:ADP-ribosylation factor like protein 2a [Hexamita inflata]